jgi:cell division protein FtsQ
MNITMQSSKRADELRKKRTSRTRPSSKPSTKTRGTKSVSQNQPPVFGRRGIVAEVFSQKPASNKRVKRRFDLALGATGAEMRLPSFPVIRFGWRLISGLMVAGLLFCLYTIWTSPDYQVSSVNVEGIERVSWEEVISVVGVFDQPIFVIEPTKMQNELHKAFPEFSSILVKVALPAKVLILVEERQPVLAWEESERVLWVDMQGFAFPARGEPSPEIIVKALDQITQPINENLIQEEYQEHPYLTAEMVYAIMALSEISPENTPLVYMQDHGLGWRDHRGWDVFFGRYNEEIETKLNLYEAIIQFIAKEQIQPVLISVEHLHAPYYRLEN